MSVDQVRDIDDVGALEFLSELIDMFGKQRSMELIGWAVIIGAAVDSGIIDHTPSLRRSLEDRGLKKTAIYKAVTDFKRFRDYIESKESKSISISELIGRMNMRYLNPS